MSLSNSITANIPHATLIPYSVRTASFCVKPFAINLWCRCPLSACKTAFKDFPFISLLIIADIVSNIGRPNTIIGSTTTNAVAVFAIPSIDTIDKVKPIKFEPISPINVFAGLKLNGRKPDSAPTV